MGRHTQIDEQQSPWPEGARRIEERGLDRFGARKIVQDMTHGHDRVGRRNRIGWQYQTRHCLGRRFLPSHEVEHCLGPVGRDDAVAPRDEVAGQVAGSAAQLDHESLSLATDAYYLLGFEPAHPPTDDGMQRVVVRVNGPDLEVRSRWGYFAPDAGDDPPSAGDLPPELSAALPSAPLPLAMSLVPLVPERNGDVIVAVVLGIELNETTFGALSDVEEVDVRVMAFDPQGRERSSSRARLGVRDLGAGLQHDVIMPLLVRPDRYEARAAIELPGATPSVYGEIEVPDLARDHFSTSGVLLAAAPGRPNHAEEGLRSIVTGASTARRAFSRSERVAAEMFVYGQLAVDARVTADVLAPNGEAVVSGDVPLGLPGRVPRAGRPAQFEVPVADLPIGEYLLRVRAAARDDVREHAIRFRVE